MIHASLHLTIYIYIYIYNICTLTCLTSYTQGDVQLDMNQWMLNRMSLEATRRSLEGAGLTSDPAIAAASAATAIIPAPPPASSILSSHQVRKDGVIPAAANPADPPSAVSLSTQAIQIPPASSAKREESQPAPPKGRASASSTKSTSDQRTKKVRKRKKETRGRKPDKQMDLAVQIKLSNPDMPHKDALLAAGYVFQRVEGKTDLVDQNGVSLSQRRNNLCRRIRIGKAKLKRDQAAEEDDDDNDAEEEEEVHVEVQDDAASDKEEKEKANESSQQQPQDLSNNDESSAAQSLLNLMRKPSAV